MYVMRRSSSSSFWMVCPTLLKACILLAVKNAYVILIQATVYLLTCLYNKMQPETQSKQEHLENV